MSEIDRDNGATIVAPVMRYLGVEDAQRSVAFFRDVLGFDVRETVDERGERVLEATQGAARLQLGTHDAAPDDWSDRRALGNAIVFFETNDVAAMHDAVRRRGGAPSDVEKVNWIKMSMFEIRDPDGHTLWFGQSYHRDSPTTPRPMMQKAEPQLPHDDVARGVAYYQDVLGFKINYQQHDLGVMDRDEITLLLVARTEQQGIAAAYIFVQNVDALYAELRGKGANVDGRPVSHPWGLRDFSIVDLERNRLTFGQPFE
ncbi:MAG: hypothetical protein DMD26_06145 [Gemmatimonadetes bacterium]|nr:MAG: hypothetical protein DMD26_06145 [Gemmatimonadota bacterium]